MSDFKNAELVEAEIKKAAKNLRSMLEERNSITTKRKDDLHTASTTATEADVEFIKIVATKTALHVSFYIFLKFSILQILFYWLFERRFENH